MNEEEHMTSMQSSPIAKRVLLGVLAIVLSCALPPRSSAQSKNDSAKSSQEVFATPEQAVSELIRAAEQFDGPALMQIFGPDSEDLVASADPVADKRRATSFAAKAREKNTVETDPKNHNRAILVVGIEEWPWEIPLVKKDGKWYFDTKAGRHEILLRRIGANELDAITICRGYVEAQLQYASEIHDDSGVNQYAQSIMSTPGKHDGLAWQNPDGSWGGPIGEAVAKALTEGYGPEEKPFHGYYFKILKGQGAAARLGSLDYLIEGMMIGGFALVAWPADYRVTGVQTFIVSYDGVVYQKDLGQDTSKIASAMELYDPDKSWHDTNDNW